MTVSAVNDECTQYKTGCKQSCESKAITWVNVNIAGEHGVDMKMSINAVTIVSNKCGEVYRVLQAQFGSSRLCFLCADNVQKMENTNW